MGGPDPATADRRIKTEPDLAGAALCGAGTVKQADRDGAGEQADYPTKDDQPPVVFQSETGQNAIHYRPHLWTYKNQRIRVRTVTALQHGFAHGEKALNAEHFRQGKRQLQFGSAAQPGHQFSSGLDLE